MTKIEWPELADGPPCAICFRRPVRRRCGCRYTEAEIGRGAKVLLHGGKPRAGWRKLPRTLGRDRPPLVMSEGGTP